MAQTIYASFADVAQAEKAAGALLDHGVAKEDISLVANDRNKQFQNQEVGRVDAAAPAYAPAGAGYAAPVGAFATGTDPSYVGTTYAPNSGNAFAEETQSVGDRIAQAGDRVAGAVTGAVGAGNTSANYEAAADERAMQADQRSENAHIDQQTGSRYDATKTDRYGDVKVTDNEVEGQAKSGITTTTPEDAGEGAIKGTAVGLGVGLLAGLAALIVPGVGLVLGAGALATALGGAALAAGAGAVSGGVVGYLKDQGVPETEAMTYHTNVANGGALLAVNLPSNSVDVSAAQVVLNKYGAQDVSAY